MYYPPIAVLGYPFIGDPIVIREPAPDADKEEEDEKLPVPAPEAAPSTQKKGLKRVPTLTAKKKDDKKEEKDGSPTSPKAAGDAAVDADVFNAVGTFSLCLFSFEVLVLIDWY